MLYAVHTRAHGARIVAFSHHAQQLSLLLIYQENEAHLVISPELILLPRFPKHDSRPA